jgi:hypothetical protein
MELFAVRMAGEMCLDAAIPLIIARLKEGGEGTELVTEQCECALVKIGGPERPVLLTLDELERLVEDLAGISNHAEDQNVRAEVERLYEKADALIDSFGDEE